MKKPTLIWIISLVILSILLLTLGISIGCPSNFDLDKYNYCPEEGSGSLPLMEESGLASDTLEEDTQEATWFDILIFIFVAVIVLGYATLLGFSGKNDSLHH